MADPKKSYSDVFDDAVRNITDTVAGQRLTKAKMRILGGGYESGATGEFRSPMSGPGSFVINTGINPDYDNYRRVAAHEGIHSVLNNEDLFSPLELINRLNESISGHKLVDAVKNARYSWDLSHRAGTPAFELPAYAGSYEKGKLVDFSKSEAADYIEAIKKFISPQAAANYQRIVNNVNLARRP